MKAQATQPRPFQKAKRGTVIPLIPAIRKTTGRKIVVKCPIRIVTGPYLSKAPCAFSTHSGWSRRGRIFRTVVP